MDSVLEIINLLKLRIKKSINKVRTTKMAVREGYVTVLLIDFLGYT